MLILRCPLALLLGLTCFAASACANPFMRGGRSAPGIVRGQQAEVEDEGIPKDGSDGNTWLNRATGRGAAANIPYADKIPWIGKEEPDERAGRSLFAQGDDAFRNRQFAVARTKYEQAGGMFPDSPLHEDALFMVAETHFFADEYPKAFTAYEKLLAKYKRSRHLDTVVARQFAVGQYWLEHYVADPSWFLTPNLTDKTRPGMDLLGRSMRAFEKVRLNNPTGRLADDSLMATAGSHFSRERYEDADYYYTLLRREYPESEHQYQAHVLGVQARLNRYQGIDYDGTPLDEALELVEQSLKQFPNAPAEDRQKLKDTWAEIIAAKAQRDYVTAQYFEQQGYNAAAVYYYNEVVKLYPETQFADQARQRLPGVANLPEHPPERFQFISKLFPEERKHSLQIRTAGGSDTIRR